MKKNETFLLKNKNKQKSKPKQTKKKKKANIGLYNYRDIELCKAAL